MTAGSRRGLNTADTLFDIIGLLPSFIPGNRPFFLRIALIRKFPYRDPAQPHQDYEKSRKSPLSLPFSMARSLARSLLCLSLTALALMPRISPIWGFLSS